MSAVLSLVAALEADTELSTTARQRIRQIEGEAEWMAEMLSASEEDHRSPDVIDLADVVQRPVSAVSAVTACRIRFRRMSGVAVLVDPVALRRSVRNLIDNSVRAAGPDGQIVVSVRRTVKEAVLEVSDSGPGFGHVPRQQGLGLLTVRRFVDDAGGCLDVGSSPLGGARITIRLPLAAEDVADQEASA